MTDGIAKLRKKYGKVFGFRIGPSKRVVVISDPKVMQVSIKVLHFEVKKHKWGRWQAEQNGEIIENSLNIDSHSILNYFHKAAFSMLSVSGRPQNLGWNESKGVKTGTPCPGIVANEGEGKEIL